MRRFPVFPVFPDGQVVWEASLHGNEQGGNLCRIYLVGMAVDAMAQSARRREPIRAAKQAWGGRRILNVPIAWKASENVQVDRSSTGSLEIYEGYRN